MLPEGASGGFFVVVDADTVWLEDVDFVQCGVGDVGNQALLSSYSAENVAQGMRSSTDLHRFDDFVEVGS